MKIGFDAKRVYQNSTGLGHYSRTLVASLATYFNSNSYLLFAPKITSKFNAAIYTNVAVIKPTNFLLKLFKAAWRSKWVIKDLQKNNIALYHGLSHEIPAGIHNTKIKTVVTIHDLIFERYPTQYKFFDKIIYRKKFKYACKYAHSIIAISEQTKKDIIDLYKIDAKKITVCYQSCNPIFSTVISQQEKDRVKEKYSLPTQFFLSVGSIIERKNLLNTVKAIQQLQQKINIPLVVIGNGDSYKSDIKKYIDENNLQNNVIFLSENDEAKTSIGFIDSTDFPAIYQQSIAMVYPSFFEGFGIPILEALCSGLPVITANTSCLPEAGGNAAFYVNPDSVSEIANAMWQVYSDDTLKHTMIQNGYQHAQQFTQQKTANAVIAVYNTLL